MNWLFDGSRADKVQIRCERDGQVARCTHCTERGLECVLAAERKKRVVKK
jgi:hypothetical protein